MSPNSGHSPSPIRSRSSFSTPFMPCGPTKWGNRPRGRSPPVIPSCSYPRRPDPLRAAQRKRPRSLCSPEQLRPQPRATLNSHRSMTQIFGKSKSIRVSRDYFCSRLDTIGYKTNVARPANVAPPPLGVIDNSRGRLCHIDYFLAPVGASVSSLGRKPVESVAAESLLFPVVGAPDGAIEGTSDAPTGRRTRREKGGAGASFTTGLRPRLLTDAPTGAGRKAGAGVSVSTGYASLHPWLHSAAPLGRIILITA